MSTILSFIFGIIEKFWSVALAIAAAVFYYRENKKSKEEIANLQGSVEDTQTVVDIQNQVIDVEKNNTPTDFAGIVNELRNEKL